MELGLFEQDCKVGKLHYFSGGAWDPHDRNAVAATCDSSIQLWDLRTMKKTNSIEHSHVRNVDYNNKKQNILVSAEKEAGIHIWDLPMPNVPVKDLLDMLTGRGWFGLTRSMMS